MWYCGGSPGGSGSGSGLTRAAVPSPSGFESDPPTFNPWSLDGKAPFGPVSLEEYCGSISSSQEDLLATDHHSLRRFCVEDEEEEDDEEWWEAEVFSTPPLTQQGQDPQGQGQSQRGQVGDGDGEGEDGITMRSMPFTHTQPPAPSPPPPPPPASSASPDMPRRPRVAVRKVSHAAIRRTRGPILRTPTPSPPPSPTPTPPPPPPPPEPEVDPLVRIALMIPSRPLANPGRTGIINGLCSSWLADGIFP